MSDVKQMKRGSYKFDRDARDRFLNSYARTGLVFVSCKSAGVSEETVRHYTRDNIEGFADEYAEAKGMYRDSLEAEIHRRAVLGVEEPIVGGKDRDEIVTYVTRYSDRLLEFHSKRHIAEYREKSQLDVNVKSGVIALQAPAASIDEWEEQSKDVAAPERLDAKKNEDTGSGE